MRDHRQGEEGELQEGLVQDHAEIPRGLAQADKRIVDVLEPLGAHEARDGQGEFRCHRTVFHHDEAAADLGQAARGHGHVGVIHPNERDIVVVMAHGRADGAALHPETAHETVGDIAVAAMPLDHGDTGQIARRIGAAVAIGCGDFFDQVIGQDAAGLDADDRRGARAVHVEASCIQWRQVDGVQPDQPPDRPAPEGLVVDRHATADHPTDRAAFHILKHHDIGALARCDLTAILQPEGLGG